MIPPTLSRWVRIPGKPARYMAMEAILRRFSGLLFPGYQIVDSGVFRILRDSDIEIEEEAEDLVRYYRSAIKRRRRGRVIRMEIEAGLPPAVEEMLQDMRSEEHTSELQSLMRISSAVFCLTKKNTTLLTHHTRQE